MSTFEEYDDKYQYFIHGTNNSEIEKFFNKGLISDRGNSIISTLYPIDEEEIQSIGLREKEKRYTKYYGFSYCYIIKIPKQYMGWMIHRDNSIEPPIPIWIPTNNRSEIGKVSILTPHLIAGVYSAERDQIMPNPNYDPKYNPTGMQYSNEQIENMLLSQHSDYGKWMMIARARNDFSFQELVDKDTKSNFWSEYLTHYQSVIDGTFNPRLAKLK